MPKRLRGGITLQHMLRRSLLVLIVGLPFFTAVAQTEKHTNIILITLDNAERKPCPLEAKSATPHLAALAAQGIVFKRAYAKPRSRSSPSPACSLEPIPKPTMRQSWVAPSPPRLLFFLPCCAQTDTILPHSSEAVFWMLVMASRLGLQVALTCTMHPALLLPQEASCGGSVRLRKLPTLQFAGSPAQPDPILPGSAWPTSDHGRGTTAQDEALGLLLKALHGLRGKANRSSLSPPTTVRATAVMERTAMESFFTTRRFTFRF